MLWFPLVPQSEGRKASGAVMEAFLWQPHAPQGFVFWAAGWGKQFLPFQCFFLLFEIPALGFPVITYGKERSRLPWML